MTRLQAFWYEIRDSLWFVPSVMTIAAIGLAFGMVELDRRVIDAEYIGKYFFIFGAGSAGARGVLTAIAQSVMTVTGVVFSVTIIALQLASTQYTPRVLRRFTDDRANQIVLGTFIATFTFALLVLRVVRADDEFVPALSITFAIVLTLVAVGALIFFINHIANSLKAEAIIARVVKETKYVIDRMYPNNSDEAEVSLPFESRDEFEPTGEPATVSAVESGYLQAVDEHGLSKVGKERLTVRMHQEIGDFVMAGEPLVAVWPAGALDDDKTADRIRAAFVLGTERTPHQDVERGIIELVDIAVKALSPSIYEPTTAVACIHRLGELLVAIGRRTPPSRHRASADGRIRFIADRSSFDSAVRLAVRPVRRYGQDQAAILIKLLETIGRVGALVPGHCREALIVEVEETLRGARHTTSSEMDLEEIEAEGRNALTLIRRGERGVVEERTAKAKE